MRASIQLGLLLLLPAPHARADVIDFDALPAGTILSNQYPQATFSSSVGNENRVSAFGGNHSPPNILCSAPIGGPIDCVQDTYVDFAQPVDGLTFWAIAANCSCVDAQFNVFQGAVQTGTVFLTGGPAGNFLVDLTAYPGITRLEIVNILNNPSLENGIGWDTFTFTPAGAFSLCSGNGSLATPCPCANFGAAGRGCANSQPGSTGAMLAGSGSLAPDAVVLVASAMLPVAPCIFFQGGSLSAGGLVFGDGVRCAATPIVRLAVKAASAGSAHFPDSSAGDPTIHARCASLGSPIPPGATCWYQTYYRDPDPAFCPTPSGNTWNVTNALVIHWP